MRFTILTLLALTLHCAEDANLPADAQAAVEKADKAILIIQSKADAEIGKIRQGLIVTLTKTQTAVTKKGDLDGANAVKAKIEALEKLTPDLLMAEGKKGNVLCADVVVSEKFVISDLSIGAPRLAAATNALRFFEPRRG